MERWTEIVEKVLDRILSTLTMWLILCACAGVLVAVYTIDKLGDLLKTDIAFVSYIGIWAAFGVLFGKLIVWLIQKGMESRNTHEQNETHKIKLEQHATTLAQTFHHLPPKSQEILKILSTGKTLELHQAESHVYTLSDNGYIAPKIRLPSNRNVYEIRPHLIDTVKSLSHPPVEPNGS